ncbi:hypothetical protein T459_27307 [Capsicum annuum]|uniref:beta-galactosidase n=1 Tax=Capsicum annuum TaxID=4072 RepID=A0A2G2YDK3_CAPAN|nr:hypothetical protein T459_27307 [Capsicum annuum]
MFLSFGGAVPYRLVEDIAFAVAQFFQRGGTFQTITCGGPFIATSYDYDAPLDEYGLIRQPKWVHLKDLHKAIKLCEPEMVETDPNITSLGSTIEAYLSLSSMKQSQSPSNSVSKSIRLLLSLRKPMYLAHPCQVGLCVNLKNDDPLLQDGSATVLHVESLGHVLHAFINGKLSASGLISPMDARRPHDDSDPNDSR